MKKRHHTPEQVIRKLAEGDKLLNQGEDLAEVCRQLEYRRVDLAPLEGSIWWHEGQTTPSD